MSSNSQIYCGNNKLASALQRNGGTQQLGTCALCQKNGYAVAFSGVHIHENEFLKRWNRGRYETIVEQKLFYDDTKQVPRGYTRATLHNCFEKGLAAGSLARADRLRKPKPATDNVATVPPQMKKNNDTGAKPKLPEKKKR